MWPRLPPRVVLGADDAGSAVAGSTVVLALYYALVEGLFERLGPQPPAICSIYDPRFWWVERVWKLHPLAGWGEERVWDYIADNDIPYNPLHDSGYRSIGCIPCTRPTAPDEEERAGRWAGSDKLECGIHLEDQIGKDA